jgi:hypothetical protein
MTWRFGAALAVATALAAPVLAEETRPPQPSNPNATILETTSRVRFAWSEIAFRPHRPKAWAEIVGPEQRISLRVLADQFEGRLEIGAWADRFAELNNDSDNLRGDLQLGLNTGTWSYLVEWRARDIFERGYEEFITGLNMYGVRIRHRFTADLFDGLQPALLQASVAGGYAAGTPESFGRPYAECELEIVQRLGDGFALSVAPRIELADYNNFFGTDRKDATFVVRIAPTYSFGGGVTLSLDGQATAALSTLDSKTGETWELTPVLRWQQAL